MINENLWKSNFIAIWQKYGTTAIIGGVECFSWFRIDGDGEGQRRMSKHLRQPDLWSETQNNDLEWVHLVFKMESSIVFTEENIAEWLADYQAQLATHNFGYFRCNIVNGVTNYCGFYQKTYEEVDQSLCNTIGEPEYITQDNKCYRVVYTLIADDFLSRLAYLLDSRLKILYQSSTFDANSDDINYIHYLMSRLADHTAFGNNVIFELNFMHDIISEWLLSKDRGTSVLQSLVAEGKLVVAYNLSIPVYALPVQTAKEMGGHDFIILVEQMLNFDYKEEEHWYDFFFDFIKVILAGVAIYFGMYMMATSLLLSFVADMADIPMLNVLAAAVAILSADLTNLSSIGVGEAAKLLKNVYELYLQLAYKPDTEDAADPVGHDHEMFYKAPYSAYSQLYCYKDLTSVSIG